MNSGITIRHGRVFIYDEMRSTMQRHHNGIDLGNANALLADLQAAIKQAELDEYRREESISERESHHEPATVFEP